MTTLEIGSVSTNPCCIHFIFKSLLWAPSRSFSFSVFTDSKSAWNKQTKVGWPVDSLKTIQAWEFSFDAKILMVSLVRFGRSNYQESTSEIFVSFQNVFYHCFAYVKWPCLCKLSVLSCNKINLFLKQSKYVYLGIFYCYHELLIEINLNTIALKNLIYYSNYH